MGLAPGRVNEHVLADLEGTWERASIRGQLHQGEGYERVAGPVTLDNVEVADAFVYVLRAS
jgi:hypothetical protein